MGGEVEIAKDETNEGVGKGEGSSPAKAIVVEDVDEEQGLEGSPSKRRRVGADGESIPTGTRKAPPARRRPTRVPVISRASGHASKVVPAKRPIDAVASKRPATKPPVPKLGRAGAKPVATRASASIRPSASSSKTGSTLPQATATARPTGPARANLVKPVISTLSSGPHDVTKT